MSSNIRREVNANGICVLTFDRPDSPVNIFDDRTFEELNAHLDFVEAGARDGGIKGVIFASAKGKIFIAGADLHGFTAGPMTDERLGSIIDRGHHAFARIADLRVPSAAAIRGLCVGGGLELTLACDWRVASNDSSTKLGLPEVQIGILPAWGGSVRLPRLVGLPKALEIILTGKQLAGVPAKKAGLVDEIAYPEGMLATAERLLARGKRPALKIPLANRAPARHIVASLARKKTLAKTRGNYPAALRAIEVATNGLALSESPALRLERDAFVELAKTEAARSLMGIFFLQERAKKTKLPGVDEKPVPIKTAAVIGAGLMGAGIAQWSAARGLRVLLKDINTAALANGIQSIGEVFRDAAKRRVFTQADAQAGFDRVVPVTGDVPLRGINLVIEAAVEKLDLKKKIFASLERQVTPETVLATNTSALSIDSIADGLAHPGRVVGIHFFNPVHRMQLVEIVRGARTDDATMNTALGYVKGIGKLPVIVKDSPGFLVNRILLPYMAEALRLYFVEGYDAARIDRIMLDFGMPMGPLRLMDEVGVDVGNHVARDLTARLPGSMPADSGAGQAVTTMIANGWLGRKAGKGIYIYADDERGDDNALPPLHADAAALRTPGTARGSADDATLRDRMVLIMVNEAARVLAEGVVSAPEDVDFGMIMGTGWAPFRGGPLRYANGRGLADVVRRLEELTSSAGRHFQPAVLLREHVAKGTGFYTTPETVPVKNSSSKAVEPPALQPA